ncbi:MAG: succinate dehydrogenase cytochrome b subunit, partial [Opitutaceae bacterium]
MNPLGSLFRSSIGRKILMAVTGLILTGFVVGHLVGNLQVFQHPDHINGYARFLQQLGPGLLIARIVLVAAALIHIWAATVLTMENNRARGAEPYAVKNTIRATLASRTMRYTGLVVLAFLVYHLAHFTWGWAQADTFKEHLASYSMQDDYRVAGMVAVKKGEPVENVHSMVI